MKERKARRKKMPLALDKLTEDSHWARQRPGGQGEGAQETHTGPLRGPVDRERVHTRQLVLKATASNLEI